MFQSEISYIVLFYFVSLIYSFIGFALSRRIFQKFPDKGYPLARILSLLVISYISWLSAYLFKVPINTISILAIVFALIILIVIGDRRKYLNDLKATIKIIIFEELLFVILFVLILLYRGAAPQISNIEKFMDFAILNGLFRSEKLPPVDVWFSGFTINYYYFGHYCLAVINKLTQIPTSISYNLNVAYIFALSACAAFSINLTITKKRLISVYGALLTVAAGNLDLMYQQIFLHVKDYFYPEARSLIANTINEFPSYSFLISDLHAHILDIPFVLLFIGILTSIYINKDSLKKVLFLLVTGLSLGVMGATNSWDYLIYAPLLCLCILLVYYFDKEIGIWKRLRKSFFTSLIIGILSLLFFSFFYVSFKPASSGFGFTTNLLDFMAILRMFGFFFFGALIMAIYLLIKKEISVGDRFIILFFIYGIFLALLPNVLFLKDIYFKANPPFFRANTVFKLWYQAWIILSVATPYAFYKLYSLLKKNKKYIFLSGFSIVFLFLSFWVFKYPVIGARYVIGPKYEYKGLDGSLYLQDEDPGDLMTINWFNSGVKGQPVLLETWGKPYTTDSLVSSYTGLPTPVGWVEHEFGWRDNWPVISGRMVDIDTMYSSTSETEVLELVKKYNIRYAVITRTEREKYGEAAGETLRKLSNFSIISKDSELLRIRTY